jgi:hypothetical protein
VKAIGILLMLCWPALVVWSPVAAYFTPQWYYATSMVDRGSASVDEFNQAFERVAPKSGDTTMQPVRNTDLVAVTVRDHTSQLAVDRANSVAAQVVANLRTTPSTFPRVNISAAEATPPPHPIVWVGILVGAVIGLFPAVVGLAFFLIGRRSARAATPATQLA